jgi:hypothetical protein
MLPRKKNQSPQDRAREIGGALDRMRNTAVGPVDARNVPADFEQLPSVPLSRKSPEDRKELNTILNWICSGKPSDMDTPTYELPKIDQSPEDRQKDIETVFDWIRHGKPDDHDMADEFKMIDQVHPKKKKPVPIRPGQGN